MQTIPYNYLGPSLAVLPRLSYVDYVTLNFLIYQREIIIVPTFLYFCADLPTCRVHEELLSHRLT